MFRLYYRELGKEVSFCWLKQALLIGYCKYAKRFLATLLTILYKMD